MGKANHDSLELRDELLQIVEQLTDLLLAGEWDDGEELISHHPEYAEELESVLPALCMMHGVGPAENANLGLKAILATEDPHLSLRGRLGDFQIGKELGRGGMGVVYEAEQLLLGRRVALKVLPFAAMLDERNRTRFQNEARAAATLHHPNIVPVYAVGIERGIHYYAMQFVEGQSLAELLNAMRTEEQSDKATASEQADPEDETKVTAQAAITTVRARDRGDYFQSIARIGIQITEALHHAHERGVIHRDIKPANILLNESGSPMVTDFGLARLDEDSSLTLSGDIVGTLRYSPPEQVLGKQSVMDERVDVYSLGATLFEMLSLRPAMDGQDRESLLQQVTFGHPPKLRKLDPAIPTDLETIVHRALERDADDRYPSAQAMADDLRRFVERKPLVSQRPGFIRRSNKWAKRHPAALLIATVILLLALMGGGFALHAINQEREKTAEQRDEANANLMLSLNAVNEMHHEVARSWISSDRDLSDTQISFLRRSSRFFSQIANRFEDDEAFRDVAGLAFVRSAETNSRLMNFPKAEMEFQKGRQLLQRASEDDSDNVELRLNLAGATKSLGDMYVTMQRLSDARELLSEAEQQYKALAAEKPNEIRYQMPLLSIAYSRAHLANLDLDDVEAIRIAEGIVQELDDLPEQFDAMRGKSEYRLLAAIVVSRSLRRLGRSEEAKAACLAASRGTRMHLADWQDDRGITRQFAQVEAELGRCDLAAGDFEQAETKLRNAIARIRKSFYFDGTPKEFSFAYMGRKATADQMEPEAFRQYCEVQASLGQALLLQGKHDEAFVQLDESVRSLHVLTSLFPANPEYAAEAGRSAAILAAVQPNDETQRETVLQLLHKTADSLKPLIRSNKVPLERLSIYGELLAAQGDALARAGRPIEARNVYEAAIETHQRIVEVRPNLAYSVDAIQKCHNRIDQLEN